ncbi:RNA polymerase sigma factor [Spirosoma koreense]
MDQANVYPIATDQQLLDGLRNKNQQIWRQVYNTNRRPVVNYLRGLGASDEVAMEIYQDTLIFLDSKKDTLTLQSKLSTYLTGVAMLKLKEHWKKEKTAATRTGADFERQLQRRKPTDGETDEAELALLQLTVEDGFRFDLDNADPDVMVQKALAQISLKHCADIFQLRYWDGLDDKQIAGKLGLSHGSLRNQVGDCKKKVKEILVGMGWGQ